MEKPDTTPGKERGSYGVCVHDVMHGGKTTWRRRVDGLLGWAVRGRVPNARIVVDKRYVLCVEGPHTNIHIDALPVSSASKYVSDHFHFHRTWNRLKTPQGDKTHPTPKTKRVRTPSLCLPAHSSSVPLPRSPLPFLSLSAVPLGAYIDLIRTFRPLQWLVGRGG